MCGRFVGFNTLEMLQEHFPIDVADTREASESVLPIHHRMPVILKPEAFDIWLNPEIQDTNSLLEIIKNQIYTELKGVPVSKQVNSAKNNRPENIQAIE